MKQEKHISKRKANACKMQVITYVNTWVYSKVPILQYRNILRAVSNIFSSKLIGKYLRGDAAQKNQTMWSLNPWDQKSSPSVEMKKIETISVTFSFSTS